MKKLADLFASAELPAMVVVASEGSVENEEMTISKFSDATYGQPIAVLSNLDAPHSPLTGVAMEVPENKADLETASVNVKETLGALVCIASCVACSHDTLTSKEFASELDNKEFHCMNCGEKVTAFYDGDLLVDESDDDSDGEDDGDDVTEAIGDDDSEEDDDDGAMDDDTSDDEDDAGDDSVNADGTDDEVAPEDKDADTSTSGDDDTTSDDADTNDAGDADSDDTTSDDGDDAEDASDDTGEDTEDGDSEDDGTETAGIAEVVVATVVNYNNETIRFATTSDTARFEAFVGDNHVGRLLRDEASTTVQPYFAKPEALRNVFASAYHKNAVEIASGKLDALSDFGFKASTFSIPLDKVVANEIQTGVAAAEEKVEEKIKEVTDAVVASTKIAIAGLNKGMFDGPNFINDLSKLLKRHGVTHAEEAATRFVEEFSEPFLKAVVEKANELRLESPEYVRGIAVSVEKASYQKPVTNKQDEYLSTSALLPTRSAAPELKPAPHIVEKASAEKPQPTIENPWKRFSNR